MWGIYEHSSKPDSAVRGKSASFWYITWEDICDFMDLELLQDSFVKARGKGWRRVESIPTGNSFSSQAADFYESRRVCGTLHNAWSLQATYECLDQEEGSVGACMQYESCPGSLDVSITSVDCLEPKRPKVVSFKVARSPPEASRILRPFLCSTHPQVLDFGTFIFRISSLC